MRNAPGGWTLTGMTRGAVRIGVLGAGHVGPVIARVALAAGYHVSIAASDTVQLESLSAGRLLEPGGPVFDASPRRPEFERALRAVAA
jgi:hypothetical protein